MKLPTGHAANHPTAVGRIQKKTDRKNNKNKRMIINDNPIYPKSKLDKRTKKRIVEAVKKSK